MSVAYVNGDFVPTESATVSILDRGFLYADSLYEMIPAYGGKLLALEAHIERLNASCQTLRIQLPVPVNEWRRILLQLIAHNHSDAAAHRLYIQITRGRLSSLEQRSLMPTAGITPTIIAQCTPFEPPCATKLSQGYHAITHQDIRRTDCFIKGTSLLANVLIQHTIDDEGANEAILIRNGYITEGNSSNVFLVKNGQLLTPKLDKYLLGGITRQIILKIARQHGIPTLEIPIPENQLQQADEIWVTSSTREIVPVTKLNHHTTSFDPQKSLWHKMSNLYRQHILHELA